MMFKLGFLCAGVLALSVSQAEMRVVHLVFLKATGKTAPEGLQKDHLAYLEAIWSRGDAMAVGPMEDGASLRGLVILKTSSRAEAMDWMSGDPLVKAGVLRPVALPWYTDTVSFHPAPTFLDLQPMTFTLLIRPASAPAVPQSELPGIGEGHMSNIRRMAADGLLAAAGPFDRCGEFRGVFVFRGTDRAKIDTECKSDPAIAKGLLVTRHYTWWTAKGTFGPSAPNAAPQGRF